MAKKKTTRTREKELENAMAALDHLDSGAATMARAAAVVRSRIEELDDAVIELENRVQEMEKEKEKEVRAVRDQFLKETTALQTRLTAAEDKLKKVQQTLA